MKITKVTNIWPRGNVDFSYMAQDGIDLAVTIREPDVDYTVSHPVSTEHCIRLKSGVEIYTKDGEAVEHINKYLDNPSYVVQAHKTPGPLLASSLKGVRNAAYPPPAAPKYDDDDPFHGQR